MSDKTFLTDEQINARLSAIAKSIPAGFHLHPIAKFINGTISTTKKGTVKFPVEISIDQLGSPFDDLRAVASPNSNDLIPFLVFVEPSAVLAAATPGQVEAIAEVIRHGEAMCASQLTMHNRWLGGDYGTSIDWQASSSIRANLRTAINALKSASVSEQKGEVNG